MRGRWAKAATLFAEKPDDRLRPGMDLEFFVDGADVGADGVDADLEGIGDFLVEAAVGEVLEDFLFGGGEVQDRGGRVAGLGFAAGGLEGLEDFPGDVAGHGGFAAVEFLDGFEEAGGRGSLDEVAHCPRAEGLENKAALLVHGEHHDLKVWAGGLEARGGINAAHSRQMDIHENDIRRQAGDGSKGFLGAAESARALETR